KALVEAYEADKAILDTYGDSTILKRRKRMMIRKDPPLDQTGDPNDKKKEVSRHQLALHLKSNQGRPPSPDRAWNTALPAAQGDAQSWISDLARQTDARSSFNELLDTPIDFSNFIMHRLNVDTLTPDLLAGLTYELMRGSCTSLTELEYHLEEVYKATTDQLDWVNAEGQQYPHNLLQPLPLIPDNRGRRVIPFEHFINNDLEYLRGGASSRKYTTSVTKTKAADYGHIKWIEDLVPREMWIHQPIDYNKHALFFIIAVQTPGSGISILLAVGTPSTGSGNLYCQWELSPGSGNALCILFPTLHTSLPEPWHFQPDYPGSTRTVVVIVTFGTQRSRPFICSLVTIPCSKSSSSVLSLVWLLMVVPGGVIRFSFVISLTFNPSVDLLVHEFSGELNGILHSFCLSCHHTAMDRKMAPKRRTTRLNPGTSPITTPSTTTTSVTNAQLQAMINKGVNAVLAARDATRNGDDSHTSGTGTRRPVQAARECSYFEFLKCKPLDFKGTEGVVELTRWFEKMESVFSISNCTASNQV
nr:hypothetical protein [Tanacetum cinerariifolium]